MGEYVAYHVDINYPKYDGKSEKEVSDTLVSMGQEPTEKIKAAPEVPELFFEYILDFYTLRSFKGFDERITLFDFDMMTKYTGKIYKWFDIEIIKVMENSYFNKRNELQQAE